MAKNKTDRLNKQAQRIVSKWRRPNCGLTSAGCPRIAILIALLSLVRSNSFFIFLLSCFFFVSPAISLFSVLHFANALGYVLLDLILFSFFLIPRFPNSTSFSPFVSLYLFPILLVVNNFFSRFSKYVCIFRLGVNQSMFIRRLILFPIGSLLH